MNAFDRLYGEDIVDGLRHPNAKLFRENCNCMAGCHKIYYEVEIDRSLFEISKWSKSYTTSGIVETDSESM